MLVCYFFSFSLFSYQFRHIQLTDQCTLMAVIIYHVTHKSKLSNIRFTLKENNISFWQASLLFHNQWKGKEACEHLKEILIKTWVIMPSYLSELKGSGSVPMFENKIWITSFRQKTVCPWSILKLTTSTKKLNKVTHYKFSASFVWLRVSVI